MLDILWLILIILLLISGIKLSFIIKFKNYKVLSSFKNIDFNSLFISLGTKLGVGVFIGTSMCILVGGPGSILWMCLFTFITSSIIYVESYIGSIYKEKTKTGFIGGIYYYTKKTINNKLLPIILIILFIITYSFLFLMIQTNTISNMLNINKYLLSIIIFILLLLVIFNNTNELLKIINKIIPFVCILFIILSISTLITKLDSIIDIIKLIINSAFNKKSFLTGLILGIKRSIFLNETLIGTISHSSIKNKNSNIIASSITIGTYFITFIISILISLLILTYNGNISNNYINLLINVFTFHFGIYGKYILFLIICLISTSSIISGIYIGISNLEHLTNKKITFIFKILIIIFLILGIFINNNKLWLITDIFMLILIFINNLIINKIVDKRKKV